MSDYVSRSTIKDLLTECPICTEHFDEATRTPRRMPCCVQSIFETCLETHSRGGQVISCPMCRHRHNLPNGVKSLPKEPLILRILDHLKIVKGLSLQCTDCPDGNPAMSRCDDCAVFLCQECLNAHKRIKTLQNHHTVSFQELKGRPSENFNRVHKCMQHTQPLQFYCNTCETIVCVSCTVVEHKEGKGHNVVGVDDAHQERSKSIEDTLAKLGQKAEKLIKVEKHLKKRYSGIEESTKTAVVDINAAFDKLMDEIQQRRAIMLSDVEEKSRNLLKLTQEELDSTRTILTKVTSSTEYIRKMRDNADKIEDLQVMVSSAATFSAMLELSQKASLGRAGVSFASTCFSKISTFLNMAGLVKSVVFIPIENSDPDNAQNNAITYEHEEIPQAAYTTGLPLGVKGTISCVELEWDSGTASDNLTVWGPAVSNDKQKHPPPNTGCRMLSRRSVLTSTPLLIRSGQTIMFGMEVTYSVKTPQVWNRILFETVLNDSLVETTEQQTRGLNIYLVTCADHNGICLWVYHNQQRLMDDNITVNEQGTAYNLDLGFVLEEETATAHVLDLGHQKLVTSVSPFPCEKPLWLMANCGVYANTHITCDLQKGSQKGRSMLNEIHRLTHE
ncbi:E3 ubiquitin-protein ligase TRIM45-like [Haliotis asinina]|uniref:E3 ubiquitin-protein ligase TRIM45-like n=1 Tax=Haliotis asinina TaxID=109174 RepID=UPI003531A365